MSQSNSDNDNLRVARLSALFFIPIPTLGSLFAGTPIVPQLVISVILAAIALLSSNYQSKAQANLLALALIGQCINFTAALAGHPWQLDTHMVFFAALAIISTMGSIQALVLAVVVTAVHHLTLSVLFPVLVYPAANLMDALGRTVMHAVIVLFEAAVLLLSMLNRAKIGAEIEDARAVLAESVERATTAREEAELARAKALETSEQTRAVGREAASAIEEIASVAKATAENAANSKSAVGRARQDAETSGKVVARATEAMKSIQESSKQIGSIVEVIDEIARRTDLLALNAAVESARAGEAGRGFAVVANEVRKLAQQSADATLQIRSLVNTSSARVSEGAGLVKDAGQALQRIAEAVTDLDSMVQDMAVGASQQSSGLDQVNAAIGRLDAENPTRMQRALPQKGRSKLRLVR